MDKLVDGFTGVFSAKGVGQVVAFVVLTGVLAAVVGLTPARVEDFVSDFVPQIGG